MKVEILGLCWIDKQGLPTIDTSFLWAARSSWPHKCLIGLAATSNRTPPPGYTSTDELLRPKDYRAAIGCGLRDGKLIPLMTRIDPGYTPPPSTSHIKSFAKDIVGWMFGDDLTFYPGEKSGVSAVAEGMAHPNSGLSFPGNTRIIVNALIKFRAGAHTNQIGIDDAGSPLHVPWVWSEFALVTDGIGFKLLTVGSTFPSHAWYVNGQQVGTLMQQPVTASTTEPAISSGKPKDQLFGSPDRDSGNGATGKHPFTIGAGKQQSFDVSAYFDPKGSPRSIGY